MLLAFLDTNVILRHLLGDHKEHSPRATAFLKGFDLSIDLNISFTDACHAASMQQFKLDQIIFLTKNTIE